MLPSAGPDQRAARGSHRTFPPASPHNPLGRAAAKRRVLGTTVGAAGIQHDRRHGQAGSFSARRGEQGVSKFRYEHTTNLRVRSSNLFGRAIFSFENQGFFEAPPAPRGGAAVSSHHNPPAGTISPPVTPWEARPAVAPRRTTSPTDRPWLRAGPARRAPRFWIAASDRRSACTPCRDRTRRQ